MLRRLGDYARLLDAAHDTPPLSRLSTHAVISLSFHARALAVILSGRGNVPLAMSR
jgi:hypothetical protein